MSKTAGSLIASALALTLTACQGGDGGGCGGGQGGGLFGGGGGGSANCGNDNSNDGNGNGNSNGGPITIDTVLTPNSAHTTISGVQHTFNDLSNSELDVNSDGSLSIAGTVIFSCSVSSNVFYAAVETQPTVGTIIEVSPFLSRAWTVGLTDNVSNNPEASGAYNDGQLTAQGRNFCNRL